MAERYFNKLAAGLTPRCADAADPLFPVLFRSAANPAGAFGETKRPAPGTYPEAGRRASGAILRHALTVILEKSVRRETNRIFGFVPAASLMGFAAAMSASVSFVGAS